MTKPKYTAVPNELSIAPQYQPATIMRHDGVGLNGEPVQFFAGEMRTPELAEEVVKRWNAHEKGGK